MKEEYYMAKNLGELVSLGVNINPIIKEREMFFDSNVLHEAILKTENIDKKFGQVEQSSIIKRNMNNKEKWVEFINEVRQSYNSLNKSNENIRIKIQKKPRGIKKLAKKASTCLVFHDRKYYKHNALDPGTIYVGTEFNGEFARYTRFFIVENKTLNKVELVKDYASPYLDYLYSTKSATLLYSLLLSEELGIPLKHPSFYGNKEDEKFSIKKIGFTEKIKSKIIEPGFVINTYLKMIWDKKLSY